jgi:hypothetical protein
MHSLRSYTLETVPNTVLAHESDCTHLLQDAVGLVNDQHLHVVEDKPLGVLLERAGGGGGASQAPGAHATAARVE